MFLMKIMPIKRQKEFQDELVHLVAPQQNYFIKSSTIRRVEERGIILEVLCER
jgi:hypothetical protein